jgi:hypothetical protein
MPVQGDATLTLGRASVPAPYAAKLLHVRQSLGKPPDHGQGECRFRNRPHSQCTTAFWIAHNAAAARVDTPILV